MLNKSSPGMATTLLTLIQTTKDAYHSVMSIEHSPLKNFDPMVAHMMFQVLAFVWSGVFALMLGSYLAFGISATFHMLFISGVCITAIVFKEGNRHSINYKTKYNGRMPSGEHE
jgi:hypothetical protein